MFANFKNVIEKSTFKIAHCTVHGLVMASSINFGELSGDESLKERIIGFRTDLDNVSKTLDTFFKKFNYDELSLEDKVRYDLFVAFALNSLYWMYLRTRGIDPNEHEIKSQISRVREYMGRSKQIFEKNTMMPRIDQGAAKRFIRSGLWTPGSSSESQAPNTESNPLKRKRDDGDD